MKYKYSLTLEKGRKESQLKTQTKNLCKDIEKLIAKQDDDINADDRELLILDLREVERRCGFLIKNMGKLSLEDLEDRYGYENWTEYYNDILDLLKTSADRPLRTNSGIEGFCRIEEK